MHTLVPDPCTFICMRMHGAHMRTQTCLCFYAFRQTDGKCFPRFETHAYAGTSIISSISIHTRNVYLFAFVYMYFLCIHARMHKWMHVCIHPSKLCVSVYVCVYACVFVCLHLCLCVRTYRRMAFICTCTHKKLTHTDTCTHNMRHTQL